MLASLRFEMLGYAALGAFALWMRLKYGTNFFRAVEQFIDEILDDFQWRAMFRLLFFVIFGAILSVILVDPWTGRQALAAGMAWPVLVGTLTKTRTTKGKTGGTAAS